VPQGSINQAKNFNSYHIDIKNIAQSKPNEETDLASLERIMKQNNNN
jgi:hypothetical protein